MQLEPSYEPVDPAQVDEGKLLVCPLCGGVIHADSAPTHQRFHKVAGGVFEVK